MAVTAALAQAKKYAWLSVENPWPAIRQKRIATLLPAAMQRAGLDAWVTICRENANDPLAAHVGGENAGGAAAFVFLLRGEMVESFVVTPPGEAQSLAETKLHDRYVVLEPGAALWPVLAQELRAANPKRIAVNSGGMVVADGLSASQRAQLEAALGTELAARLVPSEDLVAEWLSVKLPEEVEILRKAAALTHDLEVEAFARVVPGKSSDADMSRYLKRRMAELGVTDSWQPDQNPNFNSDFDRGHSGATSKIIMPGDVIQLDFGIKVFDRWCTDVQRFAYVLKPGETKAPPDVQRYWENARRGSRVALAAMKPGVRGWDVDKAQRDWMRQAGSLWVMWGTGHPVGYWAHDAGPSLSGAQNDRPAAGGNARLLRVGQTFAFDGFFKWEWELRGQKGFKTISVEEMAVVTEKGAEYLIPPQEQLILIKSK
ncbi:MAG TPA: M24 family metallopeptidase [Candidatus Nitrosotenuis sp.]|nr:M24 family metallopeptidase [Candidatus Nitrosotenuis sp.]